MRPTTFLLVLAVFSLACSRKAEPPAKTWYEVTPLLESLRPEERAAANLSELPLYDLSLQLEHDLSRFRLSEDVYFTNSSAEPLSEVVLRVYANAVGKDPPVRFEKGSCPDGPECTVASEAPSVITIKLSKPLAPGDRLRARVELSGVLRQIDPERTTMLAQGLESLSRMGSNQGAGDYGLLAQSDGVASLANFYAVLARREGGRWERAESSTMGDLGASGTSHVRLKVDTARDVRLVSSGVTTRETPLETGRQVHVVAAMVRDFALLASRKFEVATVKVGPVEVRSHFVAGDRAAGKRVLDAAARSLAVYERRFGRYPYTDLDVVEAPLVGGAGGVEFSGLVTVASMLYRPMLAEGPLAMITQLMGGGAGQPNKEIETLTDAMVEFVTAHEVAHQYWPGLVGSDSRTHPWADESLAQYSAMLYFEERYGAERAELEADRQVASNYHMMRLLGKPDGKVDRPVDKFASEIAYAGLVYGKGPYFFRELRKTVGDAVFFKALSAHVAEHRFKTAPPRAFVERLAKGPKQNEVRALSRRWLDESHGDADLGGPDLRKLLAGWIGEDAAKNLGPELEIVTQLLMKLMGSDDGKSGGGGLGGLLDLLKDPGKKP
jgi:hypothetical protein